MKGRDTGPDAGDPAKKIPGCVLDGVVINVLLAAGNDGVQLTTRILENMLAELMGLFTLQGLKRSSGHVDSPIVKVGNERDGLTGLFRQQRALSNEFKIRPGI